jgi:hypothetical protein
MVTAALLGVPMLLMVGCGPEAPKPAGPAAAVSTDRACAEIARVVDESTGRFAEQLTAVAPAAGGGDAAAQQKSVDTMRSIATAWAKALRGQTGKTGDQELDGILNRYADELDRVARSLRTHGDLADGSSLDTPELNAVNAQLEKKCAG